MSFEAAFARTLGLEGGFADDPADSGGATRFGITERVARAHGYRGDMRELPLERAQAIARGQYWDTLRLDAIAGLSQAIADELFDTGYNAGVGRAGGILQRALNALNRGGTDYHDLTVDGLVGPMTVHALRAYLATRGAEGEKVLLVTLNGLQLAHYVETAESRPKDERFMYGWVRNRVAM